MSNVQTDARKLGQPVLVALLLVAAFLVGSLSTEVKYLRQSQGVVAAKPTPTPAPVPPLQEADHVLGNRQARLLLIEYSDLECQYCKRFHPVAHQIVDDYGDKVAWVYRHFPLDMIHSQADKEAQATECAAEQGGDEAFWKMTDKIFAVTPSNNQLNLDELPTFAQQVGLDQNKFQECINSDRHFDRVEADYQGGLRAGVGGTPANFLFDTQTGKTVATFDAATLDQVKSRIDALLK